MKFETYKKGFRITNKKKIRFFNLLELGLLSINDISEVKKPVEIKTDQKQLMKGFEEYISEKGKTSEIQKKYSSLSKQKRDYLHSISIRQTINFFTSLRSVKGMPKPTEELVQEVYNRYMHYNLLYVEMDTTEKNVELGYSLTKQPDITISNLSSMSSSFEKELEDPLKSKYEAGIIVYVFDRDKNKYEIFAPINTHFYEKIKALTAKLTSEDTSSYFTRKFGIAGYETKEVKEFMDALESELGKRLFPLRLEFELSLVRFKVVSEGVDMNKIKMLWESMSPEEKNNASYEAWIAVEIVKDLGLDVDEQEVFNLNLISILSYKALYESTIKTVPKPRQ